MGMHEIPSVEFIYEALVEIAPTEMLGEGPYGRRSIVPITGGAFEGPSIRGVVLAGGADRQLLRADGVLELDAVYEMRTDDGAVLGIQNRVIIDQSGDAPYTRSHITIAAPAGAYSWLSRRIIIGTLHPLTDRPAVCIRAFQVL
jgi:Protein of unknown function (DUF3237)